MKNRGIYLTLAPFLITVPRAWGLPNKVKRTMIDKQSIVKRIFLQKTGDSSGVASKIAIDENFTGEKIPLMDIDSWDKQQQWRWLGPPVAVGLSQDATVATPVTS